MSIVPLFCLVSVNSAISAKPSNYLDSPLHPLLVRLYCQAAFSIPFTHGSGVLSLGCLSFTPFRHRNK